MQLEEVAIVHRFNDQFLHVIRLVGVVGHQGVQAHVHAVGRVAATAHRRFFTVVERQVVVEAAQHQQRFHIVLKCQIGHAAFSGVADGAAELFSGHVFVRHGFHHFRAGDEHVGAVLDHEDEVGHGGRVHRAAGAGTHDHADLRHHAAGHHVALEHVGIAAQRSHPFLNARAARVVQTNHRRTDLHRLIHHLADLLGVRLAQGATKHREVLAEHKHQAAVDHAVAGDHAIAGDLVFFHAKVDAAVFDEHVPLFERALVEQQLQALAGGELTLFVLRIDAFLATAQAREFALGFKLFKDVVHGFFSLRSSECLGR